MTDIKALIKEGAEASQLMVPGAQGPRRPDREGGRGVKEVSAAEIRVSDIGRRVVAIDGTGNAYTGTLADISATEWKYGKRPEDMVRIRITVQGSEGSALRIPTRTERTRVAATARRSVTTVADVPTAMGVADDQ